MPRDAIPLSRVPASQRPSTSNPLDQLATKPGNLLADPFAMTDEILFGSVNLLLGLVDDVTGLDLLSWAQLLEGVFGPGNLLGSLFGWLSPGNITGGIFGQLLNPLSLTSLGGLAGFLNPATLFGAAAGVLGPLLNGGLFNLGLFPILNSGLIPHIPVSHIGSDTTTPNLILNMGFDSVLTDTGDGTWSIEGGQAKVTAAGKLEELASNQIESGVAQTINASVQVRWTGLTYTGTTPIQLILAQYDTAGHLSASTVLASVTSPSANQSTLTTISGSTTVPASIKNVYLILTVNATATAGSVWFDNASLTKTGKLQQDWVHDLVSQFVGIADAFGLGAIGDLIGVDVDGLWSNVLSTIVNPLGLIDEIGVPLLQSTWDAVFNVFNGGGAYNSTTGNPITAFFDAALGILNVGGHAQAQNIAQDAQITALLLGATGTGPIIIENWDGATNAAPNSTDWSLFHDTTRGSGGGTPLLNGAGQLYWAEDGSGLASGYRFRWKSDVTDTDYQLVQLVLMSDMPFSSATLPYASLCGRMNTAETAWIEARFSSTSAEIGIVVSGTYTRLGSAVTLSGSTAGTWSLKTGTTGNIREFILYHETTEVTRQTDTGGTSLVGASYRSVGKYMVCGNEFGFFGLEQAHGANEGSFAASDRDPAS